MNQHPPDPNQSFYSGNTPPYQPYRQQQPGNFGQPPYQPMQQPYPNNPIPNQPSGPPPRKRRRWWVWVLVIIGFMVVVGSCNAIISGGKGVGNTDAATPTGAPTQASQLTSAPPAKPTQPAPTATSATGNPAAAILGGTLADFIARYGKLNSYSNPANGQYYFALYGNGKDDLTLQFVFNKHASAILYDAPDNKYWSYTQAKDACLTFLPSDATYQRKMTVYDTTGKAQDEQLVYVAPSMASLFPASAFTDENGNNTKLGTIGLILTHWDTNTYLTCTVQIGLESK